MGNKLSKKHVYLNSLGKQIWRIQNGFKHRDVIEALSVPLIRTRFHLIGRAKTKIGTISNRKKYPTTSIKYYTDEEIQRKRLKAQEKEIQN